MEFLRRMALRFTDWALGRKKNEVTDRELLEREIIAWKNSPQRIMQIKGHRYYDNEHDILTRKRTMIGEDGKVQTVENLPNNRIIDNQYAKLVNQKANYLLGQPITMEGAQEDYVELLKQVFNKRFMKTMKNVGKAALNGGIAWLFPYYNDNGELSFQMFPSYEILPFWKDSEHTRLRCAVRLYSAQEYQGHTAVQTEHAEVYTEQGVEEYILQGDHLVPKSVGASRESPYLIKIDQEGRAQGYNWERIPLIPFRCNEQEMPLLKKVKSLQDGINVMLSDFQNNMQEDARNTILVLKNYDGTNLGEFRKNLATYGVVKVRYDGETKGGVETLEISVNADNYKTILNIFRKAIIENGMGYDAKDDRISGNPNQMNIQSMYSDIDLDANDMETEFQAAFEELLWFVNVHLENCKKGSFFEETVSIIFNLDMMMNEGEIIDHCAKSLGILSEETIIGQHPWVDDPQLELKRRKKEAESYDPFSLPDEVGAER